MDLPIARDHQLLTLEAASSANDDSPDFVALLDLLGFSGSYRLTLIKALATGKWRLAKDPMKTVRATIMKEVVRRHNPAEHSLEITYGLSVKQFESLSWDNDGIKRGIDGIWRESIKSDHHRTDAEPMISRVPKDLQVTIEPPTWLREWQLDSKQVPNWNRICELARLDYWETKALILMSQGITRYGAMQDIEHIDDKRSLEAAWKRLERSNFKRIRDVLSAAMISHN